MTFCDICGSKISDEPVVAEVDGATLILCKPCSKRYGAKVLSRVAASSVTTTSVLTRRHKCGVTHVVTTRRHSRKIEDLEIVENYGDVIREARERLGMSREMLAKIVGVKESVIRRIEEGQLMPDVETARKLERALKIKLITSEQVISETSYRGSGGKPVLTLGDVAEIRVRKDERG